MARNNCKPASGKQAKRGKRARRAFSDEFKQEAVQIFNGHTAESVAQRLGLSGDNLLYHWKKDALHRAGPAARTLGNRVALLEDELRRVERDRGILKQALVILSRRG